MPVFDYGSIRRSIAIIAALGMFAPLNSLAEIIDYHQHLYSPHAGARSSPGPKGIDADSLVAQLDAAGITRAVVLSVAYSFSNPNKAAVPDEYAHVMMENNWTSEQVAKYPQRLLGFCSVNPLRPYALKEIARCAKDPNLRTGLKLHFGNSDVNLDNPEDLARVRRVFRAANEHHMAILVHLHANIDHHRPYGAKEARIFLEKLLPEAPDVVVQIAHLAGGGGYDDPATDAALSVFVKAIEGRDPRMKNVYFDVCGIAIPGMWEDKSDLLVTRIRQIGTNRLLYGSDAATTDNLPIDALKRWHRLPLTQDEFRKIDNNVAPYLSKWLIVAQVRNGNAQNVTAQTQITGTWTGNSECVVKNSPCHDETNVYRFSEIAARPGWFSGTGSKVVNDNEISMGTLDWQYDAESHILKSKNPNGAFRFVVEDGKLEGTLLLPDGTIYRRIHLAKLK